MVRAPPCHGGRCGFESRQSRIHNTHKYKFFIFSRILTNYRYNILYIIIIKYKTMIEPFLFGIVLGMIPVTIAGLFVAAYLQYRRGKQLI